MATNKFSASRTAGTGTATDTTGSPSDTVAPVAKRKTKTVPVGQRHKAGDTWSTVGYATVTELETGKLADLTGWVIESQLRDLKGKLIADFQCAIIDPVEQVFSHIATETKSWPPCVAQLDIRFTSPDGQVISTDKQDILIERGVTI